MKQQVDNLIANTLLDEGEVYLPEVGTLILRRQAAKLLSTKVLQPPFRELCLTKERRGDNTLVTLIARIANVSQERASDIYNEWLSQSLHNEILTINGLCVIRQGYISTDKTFEDMANPKGRNTIKVNPRTNYFIYVVAGLCVGFALGIAGYVLYSNNTFNRLFKESNIAPASEAFVNKSESPVIESNAIESTIIEQETPTSEPEVVAEKEIVELPSILPMQKGSSYAVWGVYNELQNAESAKNWLASKFPEIEANIYQYDNRYMVALCEINSRTKCGNRVSAWKAEHKSFKSVWVYTRE